MCLQHFLAEFGVAQDTHISVRLLLDPDVSAGGCSGTGTDVSSLILQAGTELLTGIPRVFRTGIGGTWYKVAMQEIGTVHRELLEQLSLPN